MNIEIMNRFTGAALFACEADNMKSAVELAAKNGANLVGAYLRGANLRGANLRGANLDGANLRGANLDGAYLDGAYLDGANLVGANLRGANLVGANLVGANLVGANLVGANLVGANLVGATYGEGIPLTYQPLQLLGGKYKIYIFDAHIKIGCKLFSHEQWANFTDDAISKMDTGALTWWNEWRGMVLSLSLGHQQRIAANKKTS